MIQQLQKELEQALKEEVEEDKLHQLSLIFGRAMGWYDSTITLLEISEKHSLRAMSRLVNKIFFQLMTNIQLAPDHTYDTSSRPYQSTHPELQIFLSTNRPIEEGQMGGNHKRLEKIFKEFEKIDKGVKEVIKASDIVQASKSNQEDAILSVMRNIEEYQGVATNTVSSTMKSRISEIQQVHKKQTQKYEHGLENKGIKVIHRKTESIQTDIDYDQIHRKFQKLDEFQRKWHKVQAQHESFRKQLKKKQRETDYHKVQVMQLTMQKISLEVQIQRLLKKTQYVEIYNQIDQIQLKIDQNYRQLIQKQQRQFRGQTVYRPTANKRKHLLSFDNNLQICVLPFKDLYEQQEKTDSIKQRLHQASERVSKDKKIMLLEKRIAELQSKGDFSSFMKAPDKNSAQNLKTIYHRMSEGVKIFIEKAVQTNIDMETFNKIEGLQNIEQDDAETQRKIKTSKKSKIKKTGVSTTQIKKSGIISSQQLKDVDNKKKKPSHLRKQTIEDEISNSDRNRQLTEQSTQSKNLGQNKKDGNQGEINKHASIADLVKFQDTKQSRAYETLNDQKLSPKFTKLQRSSEAIGEKQQKSKNKRKQQNIIRAIYDNKARINSKSNSQKEDSLNNSVTKNGFTRTNRGYLDRKSLHAQSINLPEYTNTKIPTQTQQNTSHYQKSKSSRKYGSRLNQSYDATSSTKHGVGLKKDIQLPSLYKNNGDQKQNQADNERSLSYQNDQDKSMTNPQSGEDILFKIKGLLRNSPTKPNQSKNVQAYIKMFQELHKRCGQRCQHLQRFYHSVKQIKSLRRQLSMHKQNF